MNVISDAEKRLRNEAIAPLFRKYAIPSVITLLFVGIQTIIDGVVLGNFAGANALASVSLILPCYSFMAAMAIVIGVGCQTLISIRLGEQNRQGASNAFRSALIFLLIFSISIGAATYIFAPDITRLLGANDVLYDGAIDYLQALVPFFPMIVLMFFSDYVIKAIGRPIYSMVIMTSAVILNIILDLIFVAVLDMGTTGAGLATGIAFTIGAICNLPLMLRKTGIITFWSGHFSWRMVFQMMYNGSSEGLSELSAGISTLLFNLALMHYLGENGVSAFAALNYIYFIGVIIFLGISDGIIPIVSYNYGANQWGRIRSVLKLAARSNLVIGLILFTMLSLWGEQIISLFFQNGDSEVLKIAAKGTSIYAFAFLINGFNILASSYFTAIANAKLSVIISLLRGLIFIAIGIIVLPLLFGINGIWFALPLSEFATLMVSIYLIEKHIKK